MIFFLLFNCFSCTPKYKCDDYETVLQKFRYQLEKNSELARTINKAYDNNQISKTKFRIVNEEFMKRHLEIHLQIDDLRMFMIENKCWN